MADDQPLARFVDPWTLVYERTYPHPIERVFEAVSTAEHIEAWFLPHVSIERKLGGACSFTWGGPPGSAPAGTVTAWAPPNLVRYTGPNPRGFLQFELEAIAGGTRLRFTVAFPRGSENPWRAGGVSGNHLALDSLGKFLAGTWTRADLNVVTTELGQQPHGRADDIHWMPIYGELIRTQWPARHVRREGDPQCPAVEAYLSAAILRTDDAVAALRDHLADEVVQIGAAPGPDAVLEAVRSPRLASVFSDILSTEVSVADASMATASVRMPEWRRPFIGFDYTFELRDGRLTRISPRFVFA